VDVNGNRMVMVCSNDYLGLSQDRRVQQAGIPALEEFGTSCTGSRFLNGTLSLHEGLERDLAKFLNKEDALTFSTGFLGSLAVLSALVGRREIMYFDRENHASLYDGARLSWGELRKFRHGDLDHLEFLLKKDADKAVGKMIVTDGVFSMSGEVADLPGIIPLARKYGARILVDDAHSTGVMGPNGRGTAEHYGVEDEIDLIIGTFSKAFASVGGFLAGPADVVDYVKCLARPFIFTAALPPAQVASTHESLRILSSEPLHRERLWKRVAMFREGLTALGFDTMKSEGPIVPVLIGEFDHAFAFWKQVWDHGVFALPAVPPAVPPGECLIRMAVNASHTREEIDRVLSVFAEVGRANRMIA
jgi:8-amino-7-oxononanoate synthase